MLQCVPAGAQPTRADGVPYMQDLLKLRNQCIKETAEGGLWKELLL